MILFVATVVFLVLFIVNDVNHSIFDDIGILASGLKAETEDSVVAAFVEIAEYTLDTGNLFKKASPPAPPARS